MIPKAILSVYHLSHFLFLFMKHTHTLSLANIYTHSLTPLLTYIHNVPLSLILSHPYPHTHYLCSSYMHSHPHTHSMFRYRQSQRADQVLDEEDNSIICCSNSCASVRNRCPSCSWTKWKWTELRSTSNAPTTIDKCNLSQASRCQFHQCSTYSFYARRFRKRKKYSYVISIFLRFLDLWA